MNDNPKVGFFARIAGWVENTGFYKRMNANSYDAPPKSWWWIGVRAVALVLILCVTHTVAYELNSSKGRNHAYVPARLVSMLPPVELAKPDMNAYVPVQALDAYKLKAEDDDRTIHALATENDLLHSDNGDMRQALNALPPAAPKVVAAKVVKVAPPAEVVAAKPAPLGLTPLVPPAPVPAAPPGPPVVKASGHKPSAKWCGTGKDWLCKVEKLVTNPAAAAGVK